MEAEAVEAEALRVEAIQNLSLSYPWFKVKQLFTKNFLIALHITLFLVHFSSNEIVRSQSLRSQKVIKIIK